jgi:hypothetical protein
MEPLISKTLHHPHVEQCHSKNAKKSASKLMAALVLLSVFLDKMELIPAIVNLILSLKSAIMELQVSIPMSNLIGTLLKVSTATDLVMDKLLTELKILKAPPGHHVV